MPLQFHHLDAQTRPHIISEISSDVESGRLYISPRLTKEGAADWGSLILSAAGAFDDAWLAAEIMRRRILNTHEERRMSNGNVIQARLPSNAHETLAEGEFNRFYARGLCLRAIAEGRPVVVAYRARPSSAPRPESEAMIGREFAADALLADLRDHPGMDTALGLPQGPNSGLSVRLE
jgi:hypothetical protein